MKRTIWAAACVLAAAVVIAILSVPALLSERDGDEAKNERGEPPARQAVASQGPTGLEAGLRQPECAPDQPSARMLASLKRAAVEEFVGALTARYGTLELRLLVDRSGYRQQLEPVGRRDGVVGVYAKNRPPRSGGQPNEEARKALERQFGTDGLRGVFAALGEDDLSTLHARHGTTTVLGEFVRRGVDQIEGALDATPATAFRAHELAVAIEEGIAPDVFESLLRGGAADLAAASGEALGDLARSAAINARPVILGLLLGRGADPTQAAHSVLDDIALLLPSAAQAAFARVVGQLLAAGDRPFLPSTLVALGDLLPDGPPVELHPLAAEISASTALEESGHALASLVRGWDDRIDMARQAETQCPSVLPEGSAVSGAHRSLAAKQRYEDEMERRTNAKLAEGRPLLDAAIETLRTPRDPHMSDFVDAMETMYEFAQDGRWREAVQLAADWQQPKLAEGLLAHALWWGAPLDVIIELAELSDGLPEDAILQLTRDPWPGGALVAEELVRQFGLQVAYVDDRGRNAFSNIAERFFNIPLLGEANATALEMATFLAEHAVPTNPSPYGLDTLDRVLLKVLDAPITVGAAISFARFLIDIGAPVQRSHTELMDMLAQSRPDEHRRLADAVPELSRTP